MNRTEILNELAQIAACVGRYSEAAQRARGLLKEVESWPEWLPLPSGRIAASQEDRHIGGPAIDPNRPPRPLHDLPIDAPLSEIIDATQLESANHPLMPPILLATMQAWARYAWRMEETLKAPQQPAPFVSDQCKARQHDICLFQNKITSGYHICNCACHKEDYVSFQHRPSQEEGTMVDEARHQQPVEAPQQPAPETPHTYRPNYNEADRRCVVCDIQPTDAAFGAMHPNPTAPPIERHIDTPDELLELLVSVSSDPQIEGLKLSEKASAMALLHIAKTLDAALRWGFGKPESRDRTL